MASSDGYRKLRSPGGARVLMPISERRESPNGTQALRAGWGTVRAPPVKEWRAYLRSKEWAERRHKAIARAGWRCEVCGRPNFDESKYQVHHRTYERFGHERPEDLRALCQRCHRRISTW